MIAFIISLGNRNGVEGEGVRRLPGGSLSIYMILLTSHGGNNVVSSRKMGRKMGVGGARVGADEFGGGVDRD